MCSAKTGQSCRAGFAKEKFMGEIPAGMPFMTCLANRRYGVCFLSPNEVTPGASVATGDEVECRNVKELVMKVRLIAIAASVAMGGLMMVPAWSADHNPSTPSENSNLTFEQANGPATRPQGTLLTDESQTKAIRTVLSDVTLDAVKKDGMSSLIGELSKADRDRLDKEKNNKYDDLNQAAAQFQQDWKDKYHTDFKINDVNQVYTDPVSIFQGNIPDRFGRESGIDVPNTNNPDSNTPNSTNSRTYSPTNNQGANPDARTAADEKLMATVYFPPNRDAQVPAVQLHLYNEGMIMNSWKIQLNGQVDANQLHQALVNRLNKLNDQRQQWPDNQETAARIVSQSVLSALNDAGRNGTAMTPTGNNVAGTNDR